MLYYLFKYLESLNIPGAGMFEYLSFRSAMAIITALLFSTFVGKKVIRILQRQQIGEEIRDLGLEGQLQKRGTPTMGGIIILTSLLVPTLLFAKLDNVYILLMIITTVWLGFIGFVDDYIKVFLKDKEGLAGKFGLIVAATLYFSNDVVIRERVLNPNGQVKTEILVNSMTGEQEVRQVTRDVKSTKTTIPFVKNHEFNYKWLVWFMGDKASEWGWLVYALVIIFIITAVSNGANLTDGLDGLATGTSAISGTTLGVLPISVVT